MVIGRGGTGGGVGLGKDLPGRGDGLWARTGAVVTSHERLDQELSRPREMGGDGGPGTNLDQLFAAGYAACFRSAMRFAVKELGLAADALEGSHLTARVHFLRGPSRRVRAGRGAGLPRTAAGR